MPKRIEVSISKEMEDLITAFTNHKLLNNGSEHTVRAYKRDIMFFADVMGITDPSQITEELVEEYLASLSKDGKDVGTRNRRLSAISSFCKYLRTKKKMNTITVLDIEHAKKDRRLPKSLTVEESLKIIDGAVNLRDKAALEILYGSGVRVHELVTMLVSEINYGDGTAKVDGKGGYERTIPLTYPAMKSLKMYLEDRKQACLKEGIEDSIYVFPSPVKEKAHISTKAMYEVVFKCGKKVNVKMHPHKFRHSCATHLLSKGFDIRKIQKLLGHKNITTTTIYADVVIDQMATEFRSLHPRG